MVANYNQMPGVDYYSLMPTQLRHRYSKLPSSYQERILKSWIPHVNIWGPGGSAPDAASLSQKAGVLSDMAGGALDHYRNKSKGGFFSSGLGKALGVAAPIALSFLAPGIGTALGSALGAGAAWAPTVGGAVLGGGIGGITGGLKGALTGGALGGLGGALSSGATGGSLLGRAPETISWNQGGSSVIPGTGIRGLFGGTPNMVKFNQGGNALTGGQPGGGLAGLLGGGGSTGGSLGGLGNIARIGGALYTSGQDKDALEEAQQQMLAAQGKALNELHPYSQMGLSAQQRLAGNLAEGFDPGDLTSDPGYQFRLQQGQDALNKSLAAQGLGQSGAALKAAQEYGQGLAATEYGNAYDRWLAQNQQLAGMGGQGMSAAGALGNIYGVGGDTRAQTALLQAERKNRTISEILAGLGYV